MGAKNLKWVNARSCFCRIRGNTSFLFSLDYWKSQRLREWHLYLDDSTLKPRKPSMVWMVMSQPLSRGRHQRRLQSWKQGTGEDGCQQAYPSLCALKVHVRTRFYWNSFFPGREWGKGDRGSGHLPAEFSAKETWHGEWGGVEGSSLAAGQYTPRKEIQQVLSSIHSTKL